MKHLVHLRTFRHCKSFLLLDCFKKVLFCRHLARNPFICDCHLRWLNSYLHEKQIETSGVRCAGPRRMAKRRFGVLHDRRFRCRSKENHMQEY